MDKEKFEKLMLARKGLLELGEPGLSSEEKELLIVGAVARDE